MRLSPPSPRRFVLVSMLTVALHAGGAAEALSADALERGALRPGAGTVLEDPDIFPIAVWLQSPRNAARYRDIGVNLYVGLWKGPTADQLEELERRGMRVVCDQNEYARSILGTDRAGVIAAWMHGDEPDNAQSLGPGKGWGPPVDPAKIVADYRAMRAADPSRPVLLNLGQGVAWDGWHGRGVRSNHPEDYPRYVEGCDIASFDIYPVVHDRPAVAGKLWYVAHGVARLGKWAGERPVWACIECTHIGNANVKPTPAQVEAEVWMAIAHGARGIIWFCHQFELRFVEAALLEDEEMAQAVRAINGRVQTLAPVLRGSPVTDRVTVSTEPAMVSKDLAAALGERPIATRVLEHEGDTYIIAVRMEASAARGTFALAEEGRDGEVRVLDEDRTLALENGRFTDEFGPHGVHIYRISSRPSK